MEESPGGDAGIREKIILLTSGFLFRFDLVVVEML